MEFIRQLVAFSVAMESGEGILGWQKDEVESMWIHCANAVDETAMLQYFDDAARQKYQAWLDKYLAPVPAAVQDEELTEEEEIEQAPLLQEIEEEIGAVTPESVEESLAKEEEALEEPEAAKEPKPKRRRK